jgi:hypothetical protein
VSIFWLFGLIPLSTIFPAFIEIYICFDRNSFMIKWKFINVPYRQLHGKTSAIHNVCINREPITVNERALFSIAIQAGAQEYKFGAFAPAVAEVERKWLVQEIKDWLGIKTDADVVKGHDSRRTY